MSGLTSDYELLKISGNLKEDIALFKEIFKKDAVLRMKQLRVRSMYEYDCALFYMDGMVNSEMLNESVVRPLLLVNSEHTDIPFADYICEQVLFASENKTTDNVADMLRAVMYGDTLLIIDGCTDAVTINTKGWKTRSISEPENERILEGPREGLNEAALPLSLIHI